ncbi:MAG: copper amine oxidase N-terminal domain-containing protein [Eubacterium sp.]|nr:copper amine oxidase N-terminal domain-containing protein [Eubacterium sp.]
MKKSVTFIMAAVILTCSVSFNAFGARTTAQASFGEMGITINGEAYDARPLIIEGTSYFPVRTLAYALNCSVEWNSETKNIYITSQSEPVEEEEYSQTKDGTYGTKTAIFDDDVTLYANGKLVDTAVAIVDDRSYVPIKQIAEALGKRATWYSETRTIEIVNPETAVIDDSIKDYYIYDLPEITSDDDYIIGNWKGTVARQYGDTYTEYQIELFISEDTDGPIWSVLPGEETSSRKLYDVVQKMTVVSDSESPETVGDYTIVSCDGWYHNDTKSFSTEEGPYLYVYDADNPANSYVPDYGAEDGGFSYYELKGEILYFTGSYVGYISTANGALTRF